MLQIGDKIKLDLAQLASFPKWWLDYQQDNVGTIVKAEELGWVVVLWTKPRWYDETLFECIEIAELCKKVEEAENANI